MSKYSFGWTDPRGMSMRGNMDLNCGEPTGLTETSTEVLCDLWMVQLGKRAVTHDAMWHATEKGQANVAQELANRNLVSQQVDYRAESDKRTHYYVLQYATYANR